MKQRVLIMLPVMGLMLALVPLSYAQDRSEYVYTIVGGEDQPISYPDHAVEGITFSRSRVSLPLSRWDGIPRDDHPAGRCGN